MPSSRYAAALSAALKGVLVRADTPRASLKKSFPILRILFPPSTNGVSSERRSVSAASGPSTDGEREEGLPSTNGGSEQPGPLASTFP